MDNDNLLEILKSNGDLNDVNPQIQSLMNQKQNSKNILQEDTFMDNTKVSLFDKFKRQKKDKDHLFLVEDAYIVSRLIDMGDKTKPYYEIKYLEVGKDEYDIGFGSTDRKNLIEWLETDFEFVNPNKAIINILDHFSETIEQFYQKEEETKPKKNVLVGEPMTALEAIKLLKQGKLISTKNPRRLFKFIFLAKDETQYFKMYFGGNAIISSTPYAFTTSDLLSDEKIWYEYDDGETYNIDML
jgi:hypothetical protein